jgi:lipoate-protein ligase A
MPSTHAAYRLPHRTETGAWHMAADLALLEWVSRGSDRLVFRTYAWDRPTLSLGRSEPYPTGWDERALAREGIAVVRRPTGGSAVLHEEEVTFAVAATIPGPWILSPRGFANLVAEALSDALRSCGVAGSRVQGNTRQPASPIGGGALCFARSAPGEVQADGYKVAGLASRFGRTGALCHASVPLTARSRAIASFRPEGEGEATELERHARSVGELLGVGGAEAPSRTARLAADVADRLSEAVSARFGVPLLDATFARLGIDRRG